MHYEIGDVICYSAFGGTRRYVRVTNKEADIKNGRSGFDGCTIDTQMNVWGYDSQIIAVDHHRIRDLVS